MSYKELVKDHYININNLTDTLKKLTESYRLLIGGAFELNNIPEARTKYVKDAVARAEELGGIIDEIIEVIDESNESYLKYCKILNSHIVKQDELMILTEANNDLLFQNSEFSSNISEE